MTTNSNRGAGIAFLIGAFMLIEGIWGCFSPVVFGGLTINHTRAIIHLVLGLGAIIASFHRPAGYLTFLGVVVTAVALLWVIPGTRDLVGQILAVNGAAALVDAVIGPICLLTGRIASRHWVDDHLRNHRRTPAL